MHIHDSVFAGNKPHVGWQQSSFMRLVLGAVLKFLIGLIVTKVVQLG